MKMKQCKRQWFMGYIDMYINVGGQRLFSLSRFLDQDSMEGTPRVYTQSSDVSIEKCPFREAQSHGLCSIDILSHALSVVVGLLFHAAICLEESQWNLWISELYIWFCSSQTIISHLQCNRSHYEMSRGTLMELCAFNNIFGSVHLKYHPASVFSSSLEEL